MYFLQLPLFSFEQLLELELKNRLREVFSTLHFGPVVKALSAVTHYGPKGYPVEALLRSLIAKQIEGIPNSAKLVERLHCDPAGLAQVRLNLPFFTVFLLPKADRQMRKTSFAPT